MLILPRLIEAAAGAVLSLIAAAAIVRALT
jgi:hypothetical protein